MLLNMCTITWTFSDDYRDIGNGQREAITGDGQREPSLDNRMFDWDNFLPGKECGFMA